MSWSSSQAGPPPVIAGVQAHAEAFSAGEMRDDLTVLALRVTNRPGRAEQPKSYAGGCS